VILVVCALLPELRHVAAREGVEIVQTGVGPVEAAVATARRLALGRYEAVINAGIAGVFRGSGHVGDAAIVTSEWLADLGLEGGIAPNLPDGARFVDFERASESLAAATKSLGFPAATGLTVAAVTTTDATAERLRARYGADVESMEGFAVLRAAAEAGVPALEVRGISNYVGAREKSEWNFDAAARAAARVLDAVLGRLRDAS